MDTPQISLSSLDTMTEYDPNSLPVDRARDLIRNFLCPVKEQETVSLLGAWHRTLATDIVSGMNVPTHDNSAMDGYALRFADLKEDRTNLKIAGAAYAGHPFFGSLAAGECVHIMTGAFLPAGCDCVVMQEHAEVDGDIVTVRSGHRLGQNIRRAGEDIKHGATVLVRGQDIRPAEMGLLASLGIAQVSVYRKLRVALFSTGDELQQLGEPPATGKIYDSNRYSLIGLLRELNVEIMDQGSVPDDPSLLKDALLNAANTADVIITSGGVSVGEADHVKRLLKEIGEIVFWKIAMKPGRPLAYGKIGNCHFFGLPGNPVAVMVTFQQFVQDSLRTLMGQNPKPVFTFPVISSSLIRKVPGRREFQRGVLTQDKQGRLEVSTTGEQGSGILSSMSKANCFIVLPEEQGNVEAGAEVQVQLFTS